MPKIPTYNIGQAQTANVPDLQFGAAATPQQFGSSNFDAINNLANSVNLQGLAKSIKSRALRDQHVINTSTAQNNLNTYNLGMLERQTELLGATGYPAMESVKSYQAMSADLRKELGGNLKNDTQRALFNSSADKNDLTNLKAMYRFQEKSIGQFKLENTKADSSIRAKEMMLKPNDIPYLKEQLIAIGHNKGSMLTGSGLTTKNAKHFIMKDQGAVLNKVIANTLTTGNPHDAKAILDDKISDYLEPSVKDKLIKAVDSKILEVDTFGQVSSMIQIGQQKSEATRILAFQNKDKPSSDKTYVNKIIDQQYTQKANEVTQVINEKLAKNETPTYEELNEYQRFNPKGYKSYTANQQAPITKENALAFATVSAEVNGFSTTGHAVTDAKNYLEQTNNIAASNILPKQKIIEQKKLDDAMRNPKTSQHNTEIKNVMNQYMSDNAIAESGDQSLYKMAFQNELNKYQKSEQTPELFDKINKYISRPILYDKDLFFDDYTPAYLSPKLSLAERTESKRLNKSAQNIPRKLKLIPGIQSKNNMYFVKDDTSLKIYEPKTGKIIKDVNIRPTNQQKRVGLLPLIP